MTFSFWIAIGSLVRRLTQAKEKPAVMVMITKMTISLKKLFFIFAYPHCSLFWVLLLFQSTALIS